jgi:hypothetical protein
MTWFWIVLCLVVIIAMIQYDDEQTRKEREKEWEDD